MYFFALYFLQLLSFFISSNMWFDTIVIVLIILITFGFFTHFLPNNKFKGDFSKGALRRIYLLGTYFVSRLIHRSTRVRKEKWGKSFLVMIGFLNWFEGWFFDRQSVFRCAYLIGYFFLIGWHLEVNLCRRKGPNHFSLW